jgi:uncharacterized protein YbbK (DUF523 family)
MQGMEKVLVSACLLGAPVRYDGKSCPHQAVRALAEHFELVPVCPECLGGLPVPRTPSEMDSGSSTVRVVSVDGEDRTEAFAEGARACLEIARENGCTLAVMKAKSPSCGVHSVYDGSFSGTLVAGSGKTAQALAQAGIELRSEIDLEPRSEADPAT